MFDEAAQVLNRQQVRKILNDRIGFELVKVRKRHAFLKLGNAISSNFAVLQIFAACEDVIGEQLLAID